MPKRSGWRLSRRMRVVDVPMRRVLGLPIETPPATDSCFLRHSDLDGNATERVLGNGHIMESSDRYLPSGRWAVWKVAVVLVVGALAVVLPNHTVSAAASPKFLL